MSSDRSVTEPAGGPARKIPVGILGATGVVGQQYAALLQDHPWFELAYVAASDKSAGRPYGEAVAGRWRQPREVGRCGALPVASIAAVAEAAERCRLLFSALDSATAALWEERYAAAGLALVSNAACHRGASDVPMIIPEINADHLAVLPYQQRRRGWERGFIVVKPNCSIQSYMAPLYALHRHYGVERVAVSTMQAISGAGYPGVSAYDIMDNIIPYIGGEEEKNEREPLKVLGSLVDGAIVPEASLTISAHCNRVPVIDGHLACVAFSCRQRATREEILHLWSAFAGPPQQLRLPSSPPQPIVYRTEDDRPQPRLDRGVADGMAVTVGRLRADPLLHWKFVGLSHNTIRGAAGGGLLIAELLYARGLLAG